MANEKTLNARIIQKHDTEENWLKATNFTPRAGEIIIYDVDANHNTPRFKIGDGNRNVNDLPFKDDKNFDLPSYTRSGYGIEYRVDDYLGIVTATTPEIQARTNKYKPITPVNLEYAVTSVGDEHYADKETTEAAIEKLTPATYVSRFNDFLITPKDSEYLDVATQPAIGSGSGWHRIHIGQRRAPGTLDISLMHRYWGPAVQNLSLKFSGFVDWRENNNSVTSEIKPTLYQFYNCYYGPDQYDANEIHAKITKARIGWGDPADPTTPANPTLCYVDVYVELDDEKYKAKFDGIKSSSPTAQCEIGLTALFYGDATKSGTYPILSEKESIYHTINDIDYDINEYGAIGERLAFHVIDIDFENDISLDGLGAKKVTAEAFNLKKDEYITSNTFGNLEKIPSKGTFNSLSFPTNAVSNLCAFYHKYNLLPYPKWISDRKTDLNGIIADVDNGGNLIINGTASANTLMPLNSYAGETGIDIRSDKSFFLPAGTYMIPTYLELQMVYENNVNTVINNPHGNGGNLFLPSSNVNTVSSFTVNAPGAWVTRTALRFRSGTTYNNVLFTPYIYPATENYSIEGDVSFITIVDKTTGKTTLIENHKDFYGEVFKFNETTKMNELFNQNNYFTLMTRGIVSSNILFHGESPLNIGGNNIDLSEYAKKEEVSAALSEYAKKDEVANALVENKENAQWITINDINPLTNQVIINTYPAYTVGSKITPGLEEDISTNDIAWTFILDRWGTDVNPGFHRVVDAYLDAVSTYGNSDIFIILEDGTCGWLCYHKYDLSVVSDMISMLKGKVIYINAEASDLWWGEYSPDKDTQKAVEIIKYNKNLIHIEPAIGVQFDVTVIDGHIIEPIGSRPLDPGEVMVYDFEGTNYLPSGTYLTLSGGSTTREVKLTSGSFSVIDNGGGTTFYLPAGFSYYTIQVIYHEEFDISPLPIQLELGKKATTIVTPRMEVITKTTEPLILDMTNEDITTLFTKDINTAFISSYTQDINDKIAELNESHLSVDKGSNALVDEIKNTVVKLENISPLTKNIEVELFNHYYLDKVLVRTNDSPGGYFSNIQISYNTYCKVTNIELSEYICVIQTDKGSIQFNDHDKLQISNLSELKKDDIIYLQDSLMSAIEVDTKLWLCKKDPNHEGSSSLNTPVKIYRYGKNLCDVKLDIATMNQEAYIFGTDNFNGTYTIQADEALLPGGDSFITRVYDMTVINRNLPEDCYVTLSGGTSEYGIVLEIDGKSYSDYGNSVTFYVPSDYTEYSMYLSCNVNHANPVTIKPMIEVGTKATEFEEFEHVIVYYTSSSILMPVDRSNITLFSDDYTVCFHINYNKDINAAFNSLDNVLRDILTAIQTGGTTTDTIDAIENLLVDYLEGKTIEEVEE